MNAEDPPANPGSVIARSRSRYKGNRPTQLSTSTQTPPKIRPEQLLDRYQDASKLERRYESQWHNFNHGVSNVGAAPLTVSQGVAEDESNYFPSSSTRKQFKSIPGAPSDRRSQDDAMEAFKQHQIRQPKLQPNQILGNAKAEHETNEDKTENHNTRRRGEEFKGAFVTVKHNLECQVPNDECEKPSYEHLNVRGDKVGECHRPSYVVPIQSSPMPLEHFQIREQVPERPAQAAKYSLPSKPSMLQKRSLTRKQKGSKVREELKRTISAPTAVEPAETSVKPAFDAPVSAVNAGERRVRVHFNESVLSLPVMPSTTPLDIIHEASTQLSIPIDAKTNILLESFRQLGLERPLRRYEHVRDIMNSWDDDSQNTLNIVSSPTGGQDDDLDLKSVLQSQPGDISVHIYHSNAPGTWDKRWITLRSDGQVVMKKRDGKETSNICHVSDFDIYIPTKRQMSKKIKPPKKYCFAVKSQQKSAMFLSTENFVHFFAAGDKELAMVWYKAVQEWRSWYLVNVMGEGQLDPAISGRPGRPSGDYQSPAKRQQGRSSLDHGSQQIGIPTKIQPMPQPSLVNRFPIRNHGPPPISVPQSFSKDALSGITTARSNAHHRPSIIQHQPLARAKQEPFAAQSLLGRTYMQRQNALARDSQEKAQDHRLPGLREGNDQSSGGNGLQRRSSQRPKPKPLLDLTPKYQEPPQHQKKGRGFLPERIPVGGLVESAANREPIVNDPLQAVGIDLMGSRTGGGRHTTIGQASAAPERQGRDSAGIGHETKAGVRPAREPFLETMTERPWVKGSLLDRVNSEDHAPSPVVDRAKRREVDEPVGEGF